MDTQTEAHIFLAEQRGRSETALFRSYYTFNFGAYQDESRKPFGALRLLNDDTLLTGASLTMQVKEPTDVLLLPVVGGLEYRSDSAFVPLAVDFLEPGQAGILSLATGMTYTIINPYETETINCLQIWLTRSGDGFISGVNETRFDLSQKNQLLSICGNTESGANNGSRLFIGQYSGREEGTYSMDIMASESPRRIFVFVLQGVFEVANRLLHEKDGLALVYEHDEPLEFEALSNNATLLLIDLGN